MIYRYYIATCLSIITLWPPPRLASLHYIWMPLRLEGAEGGSEDTTARCSALAPPPGPGGSEGILIEAVLAGV